MIKRDRKPKTSDYELYRKTFISISSVDMGLLLVPMTLADPDWDIKTPQEF